MALAAAHIPVQACANKREGPKNLCVSRRREDNKRAPGIQGKGSILQRSWFNSCWRKFVYMRKRDRFRYHSEWRGVKWFDRIIAQASFEEQKHIVAGADCIFQHHFLIPALRNGVIDAPSQDQALHAVQIF